MELMIGVQYKSAEFVRITYRSFKIPFTINCKKSGLWLNLSANTYLNDENSLEKQLNRNWCAKLMIKFQIINYSKEEKKRNIT